MVVVLRLRAGEAIEPHGNKSDVHESTETDTTYKTSKRIPMNVQPSVALRFRSVLDMAWATREVPVKTTLEAARTRLETSRRTTLGS